MDLRKLVPALPPRRSLEVVVRRRHSWATLVCVALCGTLGLHSADAAPRDDFPPALTPEQSLKAIHVPKGLKVELVAAEPLISSPVAIDFGPDGKLWVAEMYDYPSGVKGDYQPAGACPAAREIRTATASSTSRPSFSTRSISPTALPRGRRGCWSAPLPTSFTPKTPTATAKPTSARWSSPASIPATGRLASTA